mgnify:CR=1 FL=1
MERWPIHSAAHLEAGNAEQVEALFTEYMRQTISIRDTFVQHSRKENFYPGNPAWNSEL